MLHPDCLQTNVVLPNGPDRCTVVFDFFYDDVTSETALHQIKADIEICERVQLGLASRGYDRGGSRWRARRACTTSRRS